MSEISSNTFQPNPGKVVELPTEIGRKEIGRYGGGQHGDGTLKIGVIGTGEVEEYVILSTEEGKSTVVDGGIILGVDVANSTVYYAIERSQYGGFE